jgi:uncharacterized membrane protein
VDEQPPTADEPAGRRRQPGGATEPAAAASEGDEPARGADEPAVAGATKQAADEPAAAGATTQAADEPVPAEPVPAGATGPATGTSGAEEPAGAQAARSPAVVFRVPTTALLAVVFLALCMSPIGLASPALLVIFVVPVAIAVWLMRTRTQADATALTVRTLFGSRVIPWSRVTSLRLTQKSAVRAVVDGGDEVALPAVRVRHLPVLAAVSGGRIADPRQTRPSE